MDKYQVVKKLEVPWGRLGTRTADRLSSCLWNCRLSSDTFSSDFVLILFLFLANNVAQKCWSMSEMSCSVQSLGFCLLRFNASKVQ